MFTTTSISSPMSDAASRASKRSEKPAKQRPPTDRTALGTPDAVGELIVGGLVELARTDARAPRPPPASSARIDKEGINP